MSKLRPWQQELARVCSVPSPTVIKIILYVVPGGGKGAAPYLAVGHAPRAVVEGGCHVVPRLNLRDQSGAPSSWLADYFNSARIKMPTLRAADNVVPFRRGAEMYSICWDSIRQAPDLHSQEFDISNMALILDELQMISDDGQTAKALTPLVEKAKLLIIMSGTFTRGDRGRIPFLPYKMTSEGEVVDFDAPGWVTIRYSRYDALRDRAILPVEFILRDARARFVKGGTTHEFASFADLETVEDQRSGLFAVLRDEGGWEIAAEMLAAWRLRQQLMPAAQALIVTHSQAAARDYRDRIKALYPNADVRIAISDEPGSRRTLNGFRKGTGDILITVGMAYVGFDAPAISHIALLTYIRQLAWIEQAISRGVRVDDQYPYAAQRCVVYAPNDPLLKAIIAKIEAEQLEALYEPDRDGGGGGREKQQTAVLDVALTNTQAHELNTVALTSELTERYVRVLEQQGINATPVQFFHAMNSVFGAATMPYVPAAPVVSIREQEEKLSKQIEDRCRATDARRGVPFGTTNGEMIRYFKIPRRAMSLEELARALDWLDRNYPLAA